MELAKVLFFLSCICLALGHQEFVTHEELKEVISRLEITNDQLVSTKAELAKAKAELTVTKSDQAEMKLELMETKEGLAETKAELAETKVELNQVKAAYHGVQKKLDKLIDHESPSKSDANQGDPIEQRVAYLEELSKLKHARTCDELQAHGVTKSG